MNILIKILCPRKFQQTDCVQLAAPAQLKHEDRLQVTNGDWIMHLYKQSVDFETFLCGNIEMKTHWGLQTTVTQEIILPWWDSKHRNVGKIPQKICQNILPYIVWLTVDKCSVHVIDGASVSGICILNCQGCLKLCFLLSICENNLFTVKNCRDLNLVRI